MEMSSRRTFVLFGVGVSALLTVMLNVIMGLWAGAPVSETSRSFMTSRYGRVPPPGPARVEPSRSQRLEALREHNAHIQAEIAHIRATEPPPLPHLGRAFLVVMLNSSEDANRRSEILRILARTGDPENQPILEQWAELGTHTPEGFVSQRELMFRYPTSWPYLAREEYQRLVQRTHLYSWVGSRPGSGYSKAWHGWGDSAWDPRHPAFDPPAASEEWEAFLDQYPDFMSADDAAWHLARAYHYEGRSTCLVVDTLDWSMTLPDGDAKRLVWAGLRHYLVERASDADLHSWSGNTQWMPETLYAVRYAKGLRYLWNLDFRRTRELWSHLPTVDPTMREDRLESRLVFIERLEPLETAWREARHTSREARAYLDFAEAILTINYSATRGRFFEPWLIVDRDIDHPPGVYLGPHLERLARRFGRHPIHAEIEAMQQRLGLL